MAQISLDDIKAHVQAPSSGADDTLLQTYIDAAEAHVANHLRKDMAVSYPAGWPADVLQVVKMLAAHWYGHRGLVDEQVDELPFGYHALLASHRSFL